MNKRIRIAIITVWTLIGIGLITAIAFTNKLNFSKTVIKNMVQIYIFASCGLSGFLYRLTRK